MITSDSEQIIWDKNSVTCAEISYYCTDIQESQLGGPTAELGPMRC